jgi:4-phytase/acid phosphatase
VAAILRPWVAAVLLGSCSVLSAAPPGRSTTSPVEVPKIVSVTIFLRHGIRAPLPDEIPAVAGAAIRDGWNTTPGALTANGYTNAKLLARWLGRSWRADHLLPAGCPTANDLYVRSNNAPRTIASAEAFLAGLAPRCGLEPLHEPTGRFDRIFDPISAGEAIDVQRVRQTLPSDGASLWRPYSAEIDALQTLTGCSSTASDCGARTVADGPITVDQNGVHLDPRSAAYAGIAQGLLLRYAEGLRMPRVGGRTIGARDIERVSRLHAVPFIVEARSPAMASTLSTPFLVELRKQWMPDARQARVRVFVGHDNVLSAVAARLGVDFKASGYGLNDPPLGGGLGFELVEGSDGERRVRGFYIAQSPDQLRRLSPLQGRDQPWKHYVAFRGCPQDAVRGCLLKVVSALVEPSAP